MPRFINIACGGTYVKSSDWENIDYVAIDKYVRQCDILNNFTASEKNYEALYCAHFFEHIPPEKVNSFLLCCRSLMTNDSVFRIVVPDTEFLVREYLKHKDSGNKLYSEFAFINFFDQCVRLYSGGMLGKYFQKISSGELKELRDYGEYLNGYDVISSSQSKTLLVSKFTKFLKLINQPQRLWGKLEPIYIKIVCSLLPKAFREMNVSFTEVGEKHLWMYDFESLKLLLNEVDFSRVDRQMFNTSTRKDDLFVALDVIDGKPRKGNNQLFVEARL